MPDEAALTLLFLAVLHLLLIGAAFARIFAAGEEVADGKIVAAALVAVFVGVVGPLIVLFGLPRSGRERPGPTAREKLTRREREELAALREELAAKGSRIEELEVRVEQYRAIAGRGEAGG